MSIPTTRTTIDELSIQTHIDYANAQENLKDYKGITQLGSGARPQVAVENPLLSSQLEALTGSLGHLETLATFASPEMGLNPNVFTHAVFPSFLEKDKANLLSKLEESKNQSNLADIEKVQKGLSLLSNLNADALSAFAKCRQLQQG
jgi:hypothetical protein